MEELVRDTSCGLEDLRDSIGPAGLTELQARLLRLERTAAAAAVENLRDEVERQRNREVSTGAAQAGEQGSVSIAAEIRSEVSQLTGGLVMRLVLPRRDALSLTP